jgi:uncharacterized protein YceH (UPF0502 family)
MDSAPATENTASPPKWTKLPRNQRRVLGVLVEKAKTTPDQYPLSLNAIVTGSNQKSNRSPQMNLDADNVEDALDALRESGAVGEVQGGGRVARYRHYLKEWMGVDGVELAVMAELMLRGEQSIGELRGRAARMAAGQLSDVATLRPVLASLAEKKLVVALTPEGRGQIVTHTLYEDDEMERIRRQYDSGSGSIASPALRHETSAPPAAATASPAAAPSAPASSAADSDLRGEIAALRAEVGRLRKEIEDLWESVGS